IPHYHSSDCYLQMNDPISAMLSLELAIKHSNGKEEFSKIKERALLSLENLKQQVEATKEI
ncbi:MAG: CesD/SycD/LcrH family type III secretion system chaperone, partial [Parachlamydiaceae bacterium]|nr:CesD/SycD/LcrH family type III secretion system chaperone [Parachlamydiaceae bacterium]